MSNSRSESKTSSSKPYSQDEVIVSFNAPHNLMGNKHWNAKEYDLAKKCYEMAVMQGDLEGLHNLGDMYLQGVGCSKDVERAVYYLRLAVKYDHKPSEQKLIQNNYFPYFAAPRPVESDYSAYDDEIILSFKKAKDKNKNEQSNTITIGNRHWNAKEYDLAKKCYEKAAKEGDAAGLYNLGEMYLEGKGCPEDIGRAAYYFRLAAVNEHDPASKKLIELGDTTSFPSIIYHAAIGLANYSKPDHPNYNDYYQKDPREWEKALESYHERVSKKLDYIERRFENLRLNDAKQFWAQAELAGDTVNDMTPFKGLSDNEIRQLEITYHSLIQHSDLYDDVMNLIFEYTTIPHPSVRNIARQEQEAKDEVRHHKSLLGSKSLFSQEKKDRISKVISEAENGNIGYFSAFNKLNEIRGPKW